MFNEFTHDLQSLGLPNVFYAHKKGKVSTDALVIHPFLRSLIHRLAKARPKWKLYATQHIQRIEAPHWACKFYVYEGDVELGHITKEYNYSGSYDVFAIDNARLEAARMRGNATTTKDEKKALKIILKQFHAKTAGELIHDAVDSVYANMHNAIHERSVRYGRITTDMRDALIAYAENNWEGFRVFVEETRTTGMHNVEQYFEAKEDNLEAKKLRAAFGTEAGMVVVLRGSDYIVNANKEIKVLSNEELTPHMRRAIGMLKLADKGTFIPGLGVKGLPNEMYIMPEVQGE